MSAQKYSATATLFPVKEDNSCSRIRNNNHNPCTATIDELPIKHRSSGDVCGVMPDMGKDGLVLQLEACASLRLH